MNINININIIYNNNNNIMRWKNNNDNNDNIKIMFDFLFKKQIYMYYIKANEEIQKHFWIPKTRKLEQLPGRSKKCTLGFLSTKIMEFVGFLEGPILFRL